MRVAIVHGFYRSDVPSGENIAVTAQVVALRRAGHHVSLVAQYSDERMRRRTWHLEGAATTITGVGPDPTAELRRAAPDVVHVHNLFPHFSTRWLAEWRGPIVATMHNFRPMCAAGTFVRNGQRCVNCREHSSLEAVRHACYRGSRLATLPLAVAGRGGALGHPVVARADRLVAISERAMREYTAAGVAADRFDIVPNFVEPTEHRIPSPRAPERWLVAGRLSREKGLPELLAAWPAARDLDVVGTGEDAAEIRASGGPSVSFLGHLDNARLRATLPGYTGVLVPSQWPEAGPPLTYLEALAAGTPVVAFAGNGAADDILARGTGAVVPQVPSLAELAAALDDVRAKRAALSLRCRRVAEERFGPTAWVGAMEGVYERAIARRDVRS